MCVSSRWLVCLIGLLPTATLHAQPTAVTFNEQALRCRKLLDSSVTKFFLPHCVDSNSGGYLEDWKDGKFYSTGTKFLTQQARTLWFFSTLANEGIDKEKALAAARHGFTHLQSKFRDSEHGGYFSKVKDNGEPSDPRKHAYLNSFALYALAAYYRASGDPEALAAAKELFTTLEKHAYDKINGGYVEFFYRDWKPITDPKEPMYVGPVGTKTYNTHLHLLEAFTEVYRVWPDPLVKQRLMELININTVTVRHPDYFCNIDQWQLDWKMVATLRNLRASYGHDVECAWLVMDALRAIQAPERTLQLWAVNLVNHSLRYGYDTQHGGFFMGGALGKAADDTRKEWWVQSEAIVGLLELYQQTGDMKYWTAFQKTLDFIEKHHVAEGGGWYATLQADGKVISNNRATMWQGPYHTGRALLRCAKMLEAMEKT
jgi:mannobiose 2-epimerase